MHVAQSKIIPLKRYVHYGANLPPLKPKTESCFSPISFDWFIRRITKVLKSGVYLPFTVAIVTKMTAKMDLPFWTKIEALRDRFIKN